MSEEIRSKASIELVKDMIFSCDMGEMKVRDCYIDETHQKEADMWGPNPVKLLASAILGCLSASYIFCLQKKKLSLNDYKAEAEAIISRNEKGFLRVKEINVKLIPKTDNPDVIKRMEQCKKMFEQYCTVTESVREGIQVNVDIHDKE